jgi:hypothetical protein
MAALPQAPSDLRLNQRLAALHTRAGRFGEAGVCCRTLQSVYSEAGYPEEATRYGELASRYEERSSTPAAAHSGTIEQAASPAQSAPGEFSVAAPAVPWPAADEQSAEANEFAVVAGPAGDQTEEVSIEEAPPVADSPTAPAEIDLSSEWDDSITIELDTPPAEAAADEAIASVDHTPATSAEPEKHEPKKIQPKKHDDEDSEKTTEALEEIRFYLEHGMPEQASTAFEKLQSVTRDEAILSAIEAEIKAASQQTVAAEEEAPTLETVSEFATDQPSAEFTVDAVPPELDEIPVVAEFTSPEPRVAPAPTPAPPAQHHEPPAALHPVIERPAPQAPGVLQEFVSDLESSLGDSFLPGAVPHEPASAVEHSSAAAPKHNQPELEPIGNAAPTTFGIAQPQQMGEFVADLEASLGDDFLKDAPLPEPETATEAPAAPRIEIPVAAVPVSAAPVATAAQTWPTPAPISAPAAPISVPVASAAAAAASSGSPALSQQASALGHAPAPAAPKPPVSPIIPGAPSVAKSSPFVEDAGVDLAEMFGELKQDLESGATTAADEDPETHYNLGIAFREMGLLDEAIGELQKTCQAVDRGHPFPQVMQTYTWLAQCFLDKGLPEAAIRWYQKALQAPKIDEETRTALYYELAAAYETAGDKPAALKHFMEVYGRNIDYRDVAERIKPLKS